MLNDNDKVVLDYDTFLQTTGKTSKREEDKGLPTCGSKGPNPKWQSAPLTLRVEQSRRIKD